MGEGNTKIMQKADAQQFSFTDVLQNTCSENGAGIVVPAMPPPNNCENIITDSLPIPVPNPPDSSNIIDVDVTRDLINDCDEFDSGNFIAPNCVNDNSWIIGPIAQTNDPSTNPVGSNIFNVLGDDDLLNNCDESGSGDHTALCENDADTGLASITQSNDANGNPANIDFDQDNSIFTFHRADLRNTCGETGTGVHDAGCFNDVDNFIGPVAQSNTATGTGTEEFTQDNNFGVDAAQQASC